MNRPFFSFRSAASVLAVALLAASPARAAADSPFLPPASEAAATPAKAAAGYEFVGVTELGQETLLSFTRLADKHSVWIPLGKTINEITVVRYDAKTDTAVIKADNQTLTLTLRKGAVVAGPANPQPAAPRPPAAGTLPPPPPVSPAAAVPAKALTVQEEKELEARMLVTDLLEIGQQQRKAYEAAQREAAQRAANPKMPAAPAAGSPH